MRKKKKKSLTLVYGSILLFILGLGAAAISHSYTSVKQWDSLFYPGVTVENINLSKMNLLTGKKTIQSGFSDTIVNSKISVKTPTKTYVVQLSELEAKHNIDDIINQAFNYGKNLTLYQKYKLINNPVSKNYILNLTYNSNKLNDFVNNIEKETALSPVNASIKMVSSGNFQVTPDKKGRALDKEDLIKSIENAINKNNGSDTVIQAKFNDVQATATQELLSKVNTKISSFSTEYGSRSSAERANNIVVATKAINTTVLLPGDTFSFNTIVGKRTAESGYQQAPVIVGNKVETDFGGGICQVSSTLYNAILRANIKSTERVHHTLPSSYVPLGLDATIDFGSVDYKFKNTFLYPIYLESYTSNGSIVFNVYSDASLTSKKYELYNEVYETIQPSVKYIDDSTMAAGSKEEVQKAYVGYRVKIHMKTIQNGTVLSDEVLYNDYYRPVDAIIKRGTKK